jgi:hypothetical protein
VALFQQTLKLKQPYGNITHIIKSTHLKGHNSARHRWFTPVILAIQEADIRRIMIRSQPVQIVRETLSQKKLSLKAGVAPVPEINK